jgi:hypothetical protein
MCFARPSASITDVVVQVCKGSETKFRYQAFKRRVQEEREFKRREFKRREFKRT